MAINLKDAEADRLARELAEATGESIASAVTIAVRERLERLRASAAGPRLADELDEIAGRFAALTVLDDRSAEEIVGYGENGLPCRW